MVPNADRRRAPRGAAGLIGLSLVTLVASALSTACSRRQNLVDEPDAGSFVSPGQFTCDGGIPEVLDSGIASDELVACADRPVGDCQGSNDFPCQFESLFHQVAMSCRDRAECRASGCVEGRMGQSGCLESVHMTDPDPDFVQCVVEAFGGIRCPCGTTSANRYLGPNPGCGPARCGTAEQVCGAGEVCVDGICEPIGAGGAG